MTLVSLHAYKYCLLSLHLCANLARSDDGIEIQLTWCMTYFRNTGYPDR